MDHYFLRQIEHGNSHLVNIDLIKKVTIVGVEDFPELCRYPQVSSQHAKIIKKNGEWYVEDLGSSHGTYVNGLRIGSQKKKVLIGDHIGFGVEKVNEGFLCSIVPKQIKGVKVESVDFPSTIKQEPPDQLIHEECAIKKIKSEPSDEPDTHNVIVKRSSRDLFNQEEPPSKRTCHGVSQCLSSAYIEDQGSIPQNNAKSCCASDDDDVLVLPNIDNSGYSRKEVVIDLSVDEIGNNTMQDYLGKIPDFSMTKEDLLNILKFAVPEVTPKSNLTGEDYSNLSMNPTLSGESLNVPGNPVLNSSGESCSNMAVHPVLNSSCENNSITASNFNLNEQHPKLSSESVKSYDDHTGNLSFGFNSYCANDPDFNDDGSNSSVSSHDEIIYPSFTKKNEIKYANTQEFSKSKPNNISRNFTDKETVGDSSKNKNISDKPCNVKDNKISRKKSLPGKEVHHPQKKTEKDNFSDRSKKKNLNKKKLNYGNGIIIKASTKDRKILTSFKIPKKEQSVAQSKQETHDEDSKKKTPVVCKQSSSRSSFLLSDVSTECKGKVSKDVKKVPEQSTSKDQVPISAKSSQVPKKSTAYNSDQNLKRNIKSKDRNNNIRSAFDSNLNSRVSTLKEEQKLSTSVLSYQDVKNVPEQSTSKVPISAQSSNQITLPNLSQSTSSRLQIPVQVACTSTTQLTYSSSPQTWSQSINRGTPVIPDQSLVANISQISNINISNEVHSNLSINDHYQYHKDANFGDNTSSIVTTADVYFDPTRCVYDHSNHISASIRPIANDYAIPEEKRVVTNPYIFDYDHKSPENMPITFRIAKDYNHKPPSPSKAPTAIENTMESPQNLTSSITITDDLLQRIVEFNYLWFKEQLAMKEPPKEVWKGVKKLPLFFRSFNEYVSSFLPLLMLEVWETLYQSSKHLWMEPQLCTSKFTFIIYSTENKLHMTLYHCTAFIHQDTFTPEEGNVVLMKVHVGNEKGKIGHTTMLGYICSAHIQKLNKVHGSIEKVWSFSVLVKMRNLSVKLNECMEGTGICSIKKYINLVSALQNLVSSPLLEMILSPNSNNVFSTDLTPNMSSSSLDNVIKKIIKEIEIPRPKIILVEESPNHDKKFLVTLLKKLLMNCWSKHRVMVTVSSSVDVNEIGQCLVRLNKRIRCDKQQIKFVLFGCSNEVFPELQMFTFDHFLDKHAENERWKRQISVEDQKKWDLKIASDILNEFSVVLSTLESFQNYDFYSLFKIRSSGRFSCCIVDEASHCTELELLQGLCNTEKLILIGDLQQKYVTVRSTMARDHNYGQSMFERFMEFL